MSTFKQIAANRRNAEKCTGPKTERGKATSSMNALKTGIDITSELTTQESKADFDQLRAEYYEQFPPANAIERALLDLLIKSEWLTRRYAVVDARAFEASSDRCHREDAGNAFLHSADAFAKLDRIRNSAQRNYHRAMKELLALRKARNAEMPVQEAAQPELLNRELVSFETFPETPEPAQQPQPEIPAPNERPLTKAA